MDDLYPNDGSIFVEELDDRTKEENEERSLYVQSTPLLEGIVGWLSDQVAQCDSIKNVGTLLDKYPKLGEKEAFVVMDVMRSLFEQKRMEVESRADYFTKPR